MRQIFLDTETTGLSPESGDRIVEVGCIEMHNRRLTGRNKHFYLNPERKGSEEAIRIHGLTDQFLADKPVFGAIADELMEFLAGAEIIIHNASFDVGFLNEELRRLGRPKFVEHGLTIVDSLTMAREMFPGKSNSLDALCKRLEVDNTNRALHGALLDAGLLAEVYIRLTRGQGHRSGQLRLACAGAERCRAGRPRKSPGRSGQGQRWQDPVAPAGAGHGNCGIIQGFPGNGGFQKIPGG
jgi:DNA polymerase-3 subunit epsilon